MLNRRGTLGTWRYSIPTCREPNGINQHASAVAINGSGVITFKKGYRDGRLSERDWRDVLDEVVGKPRKTEGLTYQSRY